MLPSSLLNAFNPAGATLEQRQQIVSWGMPNYNAGIGLSLPYTASKNGIATLSMKTNSTVYVNGKATGLVIVDNVSGDNYDSCSIPLSKGDVLSVNGAFNKGVFFPYKG